MKGIVFTEFLEMVEQKFGIETVDAIISQSNLKSEGAYTSVGTYDFTELERLLTNLSKLTKIEVNDLTYSFGHYFFESLTKSHSYIFTHYKTAFALISGIEDHIHVHVLKIYPDAELPYLITHEQTNTKLVIEYQSKRAMHSFALGLIDKTLEHYHEKASVTRELLNETGTKVLFTLIKNV